MVTKITVATNPWVKSLAASFDLTQHEVKVMTGQVDYRFRKHEADVFKTGGTPSGPSFTPLSLKYGKWKKRHFPGRKILSLTGTLRKSLTNKGPQHVARGVAKPSPTITVGTSNRLAAYHGPGRFHNPRLPVRDALRHTPKNEQRYMDIVKAYFVEQKIPRIEKVLSRWKAKLVRTS